ncbi:hypothetical protein ABBQ38_006133 [Trebouxia sp. C0009 RCD-2024]
MEVSLARAVRHFLVTVLSDHFRKEQGDLLKTSAGIEPQLHDRRELRLQNSNAETPQHIQAALAELRKQSKKPVAHCCNEIEVLVKQLLKEQTSRTQEVQQPAGPADQQPNAGKRPCKAAGNSASGAEAVKISQKFKRQVRAMCAEPRHKVDASLAVFTSTKAFAGTSDQATAAVTPLPPTPPSPAMPVTLYANLSSISDHKSAAPAKKHDIIASGTNCNTPGVMGTLSKAMVVVTCGPFADNQNKQSVIKAKTTAAPTSSSACTPSRQAAPGNNDTTLDTAARAAQSLGSNITFGSRPTTYLNPIKSICAWHVHLPIPSQVMRDSLCPTAGHSHIKCCSAGVTRPAFVAANIGTDNSQILAPAAKALSTAAGSSCLCPTAPEAVKAHVAGSSCVSCDQKQSQAQKSSRAAAPP